LAAVVAFSARAREDEGVLACVETVEIKITTPGEVLDAAADRVPGLDVYCECPAAAPNLDVLLDAIHSTGCGAKLRTGGLVAEAIPSSLDVATFIAGCTERGIPFKATAGLHHPLRGVHGLTNAADAPRAEMHGFLNVFVAAALAATHRLDARSLVALVEERSPTAFSFDEGGVSWRGLRADTAAITAARMLARGFGSCSFEEPVDDLKALGVYL
jgi:hypothetical protein